VEVNGEECKILVIRVSLDGLSDTLSWYVLWVCLNLPELKSGFADCEK
jgi:hypothetical protein